MNQLQPHNDPDDIKRLMVLMLLIGLGLIAWNYIYEAPRQAALQQQMIAEQQKTQAEVTQLQARAAKEREVLPQKISSTAKVDIASPLLDGSLSLQGGRLNYMVLKDYAQTTDEGSPDVVLLQPAGNAESYFIEFGWLSQGDNAVKTPDSNTVWEASNATLAPEQPVTLRWDNGEGVKFETEITLTDDYLFTLNQRVINSSDKILELLPYGYINRTYAGDGSEFFILHEGPIGVVEEGLEEIAYSDLKEDGKISFKNADGWVGITDKYWLTALIPHSGNRFTANYKYYEGKDGSPRYQVDYLGKPVLVNAGGIGQYESLAFIGAKKLRLLDRYSQEYDIPLFDRAVDLGFLYFLTKPLFLLLTWLYGIAGDFGLAIILLTVLIKAAMYPLANKSYISMNEMKRLQPKLAKLKERHSDDKVKFNQEMMKIYKKEKINPAAGCLPMLVQIPVFFALYKVLFVTIEMRHANFYSIIEDLSAGDPTNLFTVFGLIDWNPPSLMHLGILPILMAISMWGQQQLNPKPTDPTQAKVMGLLPWVFMFVLAGFPAGLLVYWIWSNILSILQQWSIKSRYSRRSKKRDAELDAKAANDG